MRGSGKGSRTDAPSRTTALRGRIVTDHEVWEEGTVLLEGGTIEGVERGKVEADEIHEYPGCLVLPGFVDLQVNGSFGIDVASHPGRLTELSRGLATTGTTGYLPTVISSPAEVYRQVLPALAEAMEQAPPGAKPLGLHLEGPFVNAEKKGAHPPQLLSPPDADLLHELLELGPVRMLTLAPELEGADRLAGIAAGRGVVVSAGHSNASFEQALASFDRHVSGVTHLFNAMSPLHHRQPGLPGAAFSHPRPVSGIIADGRHVHPGAVALALRMLGPDRLYLATDAVAATGMGPGEYPLASRQTYLDAAGGVPTLGDGTLAGSTLTMDEVFRNVLAFTGCTIPEAARMAAATPAQLVGEGERKGRMAPGYDADVTVLREQDLSVAAVYRGGDRVYG